MTNPTGQGVSNSERGREKLRVLLLSDHDDFRADVATAFGVHGHHVHSFRTPEDARSALPIPDLDIGIVDSCFAKGGMTGLAVADRLHETDRHFPVIVASCHWTPHLGAECARRWATFSLRTSSGPSGLMALVKQIVQGMRSSPARVSRLGMDCQPDSQERDSPVHR